ncbi:MAG: sporulation protein YunB [Thermaerobacterales bacterium]
MGRNRNGRSVLAVILLVAVITAAASLLVFERTMAPVLVALAERQAEIMGVETVSRALNRHIADEVAYEDLIDLKLDQSGQVAFMQLNTTSIHRIVADIQATIQGELDDLSGTTFDIPLGLVLGSDLLAAYGPPFKARMLPYGTVRVVLDQAFEHAGINQTRHTIYLNVEARVRVMVPLQQDDVVVTTRTPLVEAVIVGPVPTHYLNLDLGMLPWTRQAQ